MKTIKAYRLGHDDEVTYILPSRRKAIEQLESTKAKVFVLSERREIEGGIPLRWERVEQ